MNCPQNAKKRSLFARKNGRKAPQREKYLISGFGHLRCSALENSGSKSPQTRMKPEKNGTTSILSSLHGPPRGIRTPDLQNRNLTLYPAALWAEMRFPYYSAAWGLCQDFRERRTSLRREKVLRAVQDAGGCFLRGAEERGRERWEAAAFSGFLRETGERDARKGRAKCARKTLKAPGALRTAPGTAAPAAAARTGKCIPAQTQ